VIDAPAGWVWRLRDGRIVEGRAYDSRRGALEAAGLTDEGFESNRAH
jgi:ketosteroid isomerase-like protein